MSKYFWATSAHVLSLPKCQALLHFRSLPKRRLFMDLSLQAAHVIQSVQFFPIHIAFVETLKSSIVVEHLSLGPVRVPILWYHASCQKVLDTPFTVLETRLNYIDMECASLSTNLNNKMFTMIS